MVAYNKFDQFPEDLGAGVHDLEAAGDTLKIYASNAAPSVDRVPPAGGSGTSVAARRL